VVAVVKPPKPRLMTSACMAPTGNGLMH
jgi:hypothetical protein